MNVYEEYCRCVSLFDQLAALTAHIMLLIGLGKQFKVLTYKILCCWKCLMFQIKASMCVLSTRSVELMS